MSGFDFRQLEKFRDALEEMKEDAPEIIEGLVVDEGVYVVKQARILTKNKEIGNTGAYRMNWHTGDKAKPAWEGKDEYDGTPVRKSGDTYFIDIYNNLDYAKHLEYGFRSHFVPAKYLDQAFINRYMRDVNKARKASGLKRKDWKKNPMGGIYVGEPGGYVKGKYILRDSMKNTMTTQKYRLERRWNKKVKDYVEGRL